MKEKNIKELRKLSMFCQYSGLIFIFLGIVVIFVDFINHNRMHLQTGFFIFMSGYTFHKTGQKVSKILFDERTEVTWDVDGKNNKE